MFYILCLFLRIVRYLIMNAYSWLVFLIFDLRIVRILIILVKKCNILNETSFNLFIFAIVKTTLDVFYLIVVEREICKFIIVPMY